MKIGIIGAGMVGSSLAKAVTRVGHSVMLSSREPDGEKMQALITEIGSQAQAGTVADTLAFSDITAVALRWDAVESVLQEGDWRNRTIIDMMNRFGGESSALTLARLTGGRVVKAFNTIGAEHYQNPLLNGERASMFIAGDDAQSKAITTQIASDIGFEVVDAGSLEAAVHLENLAALWVHLVRQGHGRDFAFRLIHG